MFYRFFYIFVCVSNSDSQKNYNRLLETVELELYDIGFHSELFRDC